MPEYGRNPLISPGGIILGGDAAIGCSWRGVLDFDRLSGVSASSGGGDLQKRSVGMSVTNKKQVSKCWKTFFHSSGVQALQNPGKTKACIELDSYLDGEAFPPAVAEIWASWAVADTHGATSPVRRGGRRCSCSSRGRKAS